LKSAVGDGAISSIGGASQKRFRQGTHRVTPPAATLARVRPLAGRIGLTRVADVTGLDYIGLPVFMAVRPGSRNFAIHNGKGATADAAEASAIMEAVELWSAEAMPPHRLVRGAPRVLPQHLVTGRRAGAALRWVGGVDLLTEQPVQIPEALALADFRLPVRQGHAGLRASTNAVAAGNTREEALLHALCEAIERDAFSLWRQSPAAVRSRTRIDLATVDDPVARHMLDLLRRAKLAVTAWEITSDILVPAYHCAIDDRDARAPFLGLCMGVGCHPSAAIALARAVAEAVQSRSGLIVGARDDLAPANYAGIGHDSNLASLLYAPRVNAKARRFDDHQSFDTDSVAEDLRLTLKRVQAAGVSRVIAVDLTHREIGIPVWRVLTPELEGMHHKPGYKPGPRAQGLIARYDRAA
jgi:YcaO-like protein with predicted kinase domain